MSGPLHGFRVIDATQMISMGPDRFLDGRRFDPDRIVSYLEQSEISRLRIRLDDLAAWNG